MNEYKTTVNSIAGIVMRGEPIHSGHISIIFEAMTKHELVYIYLGSRDKEVSFDNPFTVRQRMDMLKMVFGKSSKLKIIPLADIGASTKQEWMNYISSETSKHGFEPITDYYAGDQENAIWVTDVEHPITGNYLNIHIKDRLQTTIMSGTRIRKSIATKSDEWKKHVPAVLHKFIEDKFPEEFYQIIS